MIRECSLDDISDGKTYDLNDMVKADTGSCMGCHKCCTGMGSSIVLDPYDVWLMKVELKKNFNELLSEGRIELNMVDGLILPNIKMGENDRCTFLDDEGRCSIYTYRPGICRIFPLGRVYNDDGFKYFIQKDECIKVNRAKVKVRKWIDIEHIEENQKFILDWHHFIRNTGNKMFVLRNAGKGDRVREIAMYVLNEFYVADMAQTTDVTEIYSVLESKIEAAEKNI